MTNLGRGNPRCPCVANGAFRLGGSGYCDFDESRFYRRKLVQKGLGKARVAVARKVGIRLWIMLRDKIDYQEFCRRGQMRQKTVTPVAGMPETGNGAKSHRPVDEATRLPES